MKTADFIGRISARRDSSMKSRFSGLVLAQVIYLIFLPVPTLAQQRGGQRGGNWQGFQRQSAPRQGTSQQRQVAPRQNTPQHGGYYQQNRPSTGTAQSQQNYSHSYRGEQQYNGGNSYGHGGYGYRGGEHRYRDGRGWHNMLFLNGGWGYWWGYPRIWCPAYGYDPYYGYEYGAQPYNTYAPAYPPYIYGGSRYVGAGIKFDLELLPKSERDAAKKGIVSVDGAEVGIVKNFEGKFHSAFPLGPGNHEISVVTEDGKSMTTTVAVQEGVITRVGLRFNEGPDEQK
ncbi:MAG: hypothetical protein KGI72_01265 [Patescibacteria group bacterium]|nr:hypothetical protein [Patescibacteria group bacterium]MDE2015140.1 hypothetical protein [Patescibacteria group bacterium]